jgi:hypothetical protein
MGNQGTRRLGIGAAALNRIVLGLVASLAVTVVSAHAAWAQDPDKAVKKIIELNMKALDDVDAQNYTAARDGLLQAVATAKQASLFTHKMTARTYVHLGCVYIVGFKDKARARKFFSLAKSIRSDIQLTPRLSNPELETAFADAPAEEEATPSDPIKPDPIKPEPRKQPVANDGSEPDLPSPLPRELYCPSPEEAVANQDVVVRCAAEASLKVDRVLVYYRSEGAESFAVGALQVSPKGWFEGALPADAVVQGTVQYYFEARDVADSIVANDGREDSPNLLTVKAAVRRAVRQGQGGGAGDDPLKGLKADDDRDRYLAGLHRRGAGALFFNAGLGSGFGWHSASVFEWNTDYSADAGTGPVGSISYYPEIGYMVTDHLGFSLQGRIEQIFQQGAGDGRKAGSPATGAVAVLARGLWAVDLFDGNWQLLLSGNFGWGPGEAAVRFQIPPDEKVGTLVTDTVRGGAFLYGAGVGMLYNVTRWFGLAVETRALGAGPRAAFLGEGWVSVQFSIPTKSNSAVDPIFTDSSDSAE